MRKISILVLFLVILSSSIRAQQDVHFSQYMFTPAYWNPAFAGADGKTSLMALSRTQWLGYNSSFDNTGMAPSTQFLGFTTPVNFKDKPFGLGANFVYDQLGEMKNLEVQVSIAYFKQFNRGRLSFGLKPGIYSQTIDFTKLVFVNPDDVKNTGQKESNFTPDLGAGIAYTTDIYNIGIGINHLLSPTFDYGGNVPNSEIGNSLETTYNIYADYQYDFAYNITFKPSVIVKTDFNTFTFDLSLLATYGERIWGGLSYRDSEAIIFLFGYSFLENNTLSLGYSMDYVVVEQSAKQATSHEFYIRYDLPSLSTGNKKIIRTPRFRF